MGPRDTGPLLPDVRPHIRSWLCRCSGTCAMHTLTHSSWLPQVKRTTAKRSDRSFSVCLRRSERRHTRATPHAQLLSECAVSTVAAETSPTLGIRQFAAIARGTRLASSHVGGTLFGGSLLYVAKLMADVPRDEQHVLHGHEHTYMWNLLHAQLRQLARAAGCRGRLALPACPRTSLNAVGLMDSTHAMFSRWWVCRSDTAHTRSKPCVGGTQTRLQRQGRASRSAGCSALLHRALGKPYLRFISAHVFGAGAGQRVASWQCRTRGVATQASQGVPASRTR